MGGTQDHGGAGTILSFSLSPSHPLEPRTRQTGRTLETATKGKQMRSKLKKKGKKEKN